MRFGWVCLGLVWSGLFLLVFMKSNLDNWIKNLGITKYHVLIRYPYCTFSHYFHFSLILYVLCFKGAATSRKEKISKKYNIGDIDLKYTQYIPMIVSDIVYRWKSDQTSITSIIEIEIWNLVWLNLRSLLTNDHLAFCDYLHQSWNIRSWFCLPREKRRKCIFTYKKHVSGLINL